jgi:lipid-A-disaccharide synthase-like uncharacterized protein
MAGVLIFGVWLVLALGRDQGLPDLRDNAFTVPITISAAKGALEALESPQGSGEFTYRLLYRDGSASGVLTRDEVARFIPPATLDDLKENVLEQSPTTRVVFRLFNITGWVSMVWVAIGLGGQVAFFGRMLIQWIVSERKRESVVPEAFWWLSLSGGVCLFTYFVWRQDIVGVLGQTTGVVIYARNLRLIHKRRRRERRNAEREAIAPSESHPN